MFRPIAPAGRLFVAVALPEGFTWAGLLIGLLLKYGFEATYPSVGPLHGAVLLFHLAVIALIGAAAALAVVGPVACTGGSGRRRW